MPKTAGDKKEDRAEKERSFSEAGKKAQDFLDAHREDYISRAENQNQRSQLALWYAEGLSDDFIEKVFTGEQRSPVESDLMHILALLIGEDRALSCSRSLSVRAVRDAVKNDALKEALPDLKAAGKLTKELEESRKRFDRELNFLKSERKSMQDSYEAWVIQSGKNQEALTAAEKENADMTVKLAVSEKEKEIGELKKELESSKRTRNAESEKNGRREGFFKKRERRRREDVLIQAAKKENLSEEQFEILKDAYKKGLSERALLTLSDETIPGGNLTVLENLLLKKEGGAAAGEEL